MEAGREEDTERAAKIILGGGLTNDAPAFAGGEPKTFGDFDHIYIRNRFVALV